MTTTTDDVLDLEGIAKHLRINPHRVRRWRENFLHGGPQVRIRLLAPDRLANPPRWSRQAVEEFATGLGLWPPGRDQHECRVCGGMYAIYNNVGTIYPHGWKQPAGADYLEPCAGSLGPPANAEIAGAVAA